MNSHKLSRKNMLLLLVIVVVFSAIILAVFQKSFAATSSFINIEDKRTSNKSAINMSNDTNYIYFDVTLSNKLDNEDYYLSSTLKLTKTDNDLSDKTIVATLEQSSDNTNFSKISDTTLSLDNSAVLTSRHSINNNKMYYRVSFKSDDEAITITDENINYILNVKSDLAFNYEFTERVQEFVTPLKGDYRIELWGASGNYYDDATLAGAQKSYAGEGAYTAGTINLNENDKLYVYTGKNATDGAGYYGASFNGNKIASRGANIDSAAALNHYYSSGGGATDVRLVEGESWYDDNSLKSRIMIAAGGGGALYSTKNNEENVVCSGSGGSGGGLVGYPGYVQTKEISGVIYGELLKKGFGLVPSGQTKGGSLDYCAVAVNSEYYNSDANKTDSFRNGYPAWYAMLQEYPYFGGEFGIGASTNNDATHSTSITSSGGGGYYGGSCGCNVIPVSTEGYPTWVHGRHTGGSGGSSYISGHTGSIGIADDGSAKCTENVPVPSAKDTEYDPVSDYVGTTDNSCSVHYSGKKFTDTVMIDGEGYNWTNKRENKRQMPSYNDETLEKGNPESGAARITAVSLSAEKELTKKDGFIVKYETDKYGEITDVSEEPVGPEENPKGTTEKPNPGYHTVGWTCDKKVTLKDGTSKEANKAITMDEIKTIVVRESLTCKVTHEKDQDVIDNSSDEEDKLVPKKQTNVSKNPYTADVIKPYIAIALLTFLGVTFFVLLREDRKDRLS